MKNNMRILENTDAIKSYSVDELSSKAYDRAYHSWSDNCDILFKDEANKTLEVFCDIFKIKVISISSVYGASFYIKHDNFYIDDEINELKGIRLLKYLNNNYFDKLFPKKVYYLKGYSKKRTSNIYYSFISPLTNSYFDDDILQPIFDFLEKPDENLTFYQLLEQCLDYWLGAYESECQYFSDEEHFIEYCKENKILFDEKGTVLNS